ncbi:MAG: FUSC family protein [Blastocatellia bacterium]
MNEQVTLLRQPPYWRRLLRVEASGIRTAAAAVLPFLLGQLLGYPVIGLMIGLGGLYLAVVDKEVATLASLLIAIGCNAVAALAGAWIGNHALPAIIAMAIWAFAAGMMSAYGDIASQIGFIATIVFAVALGQPASLNADLVRMIEFTIGGLWGVMLTLLLWRFQRAMDGPAEQTETDAPDSSDDAVKPGLIERFTSNLTFGSIIFRHALRLSIAATIAIALDKGLQLERGYWLIITVLVIVKPIFADTRRRAIERVVGSIVGGTVAALLVAAIHNAAILDVLLLAFSVLAYSHVRNNYGFFMLFLTPFVVLMIDIVEPSNWHIALLRIVDTTIGGAIALTVAYLLRPRSAFRW